MRRHAAPRTALLPFILGIEPPRRYIGPRRRRDHAQLLAGRDVALVADAGTPTISDPGAELVTAAAAAGVPVVSLPGPCAAITALAASGFGARAASKSASKSAGGGAAVGGSAAGAGAVVIHGFVPRRVA